MKGGMKFYRGSGAGARAYLESDHHRADDYYLAEGYGLAELLVVDGPGGAVVDRIQMDGDTYEAWVEGRDVRTAEHLPKGELRQDDHALRFAEVIVNGPKSWSLAAGLHPDVSAALDQAQDRAGEEIARFLSGNVCTRVGPRGQQRQVHAQQIEVARIRHFTSRAGDPHRHIHLQLNARVPAAGRWRGIDSAAVLRMQRAINGIGHRAVAADPEFRAALAAHGYTLDLATGEIDQLAQVVPAMSKRSQQVAKNIARYEKEWRKDNLGQEPGPELRRAWDQRAWADKREAKKNHPTRGQECEQTWLTELRRLGIDVDAHRAAGPVELAPVRPGEVDRDEVAARVVRVLSAGVRGRSTWNDFDVRGVAEEVLAGRNVIAGQAVLRDLAEDITRRARARCLTVVDKPVPAHVRHLTSQEVLDLERDIQGRLAVRGAFQGVLASLADIAAVVDDQGLDQGQIDGVRAIAGTDPVVLVEGAAGTGKSTMLAAANTLITNAGRRMKVVAPSRNAALLAAEKIGAADGPAAAGLAFAHGFRWDRDGVWTRLRPGEVCPLTGAIYDGPHSSAKLRPGDVLVVDEAGMLDQQTAQALLHIADEADARIVYLGDRHQLPAVGRGGVLDMVAAHSRTALELSAVHRFLTSEGAKDTAYADLSLRIRTGVDPEAVFDQLLDRGHVQLHDTDTDALAALAAETAQRHLDGETQSVAVDTNEAADAVNEVVRDRLVDAGLVDDQQIVHGRDGLRIGAGDRVVTRENDNRLGVANRMTWTVNAVQPDGGLELIRPGRPHPVTLDAGYVRENIHLAYASTVHGVQGETSDHGRLHLTDMTDAAALYVGMTRGRRSNTVHIVARTYDQAREQWVAASGRDRADLGLVQARTDATAAAANYAPEGHDQRPTSGRRGGTRRDRTNFAERLSRVNSRLQEEGCTPAGSAPSSEDSDAPRYLGVQRPLGRCQ